VCLHRVIGRGFAEYPFAPRGNFVCAHLKCKFSPLCTGAADHKTKNATREQNFDYRKVRESCNSLAYCSRGKVLMLTERVKISINALYLYRADQVVNVLNYWARCQHWYTFWMISNHNHICLPYQIISETHLYDTKTEFLI
jgi:hypothetical protein